MLQQPQYDRPPEGLARGRWEAPWWAIAALGIIVVVAALVHVAVRARRRQRPLPPDGRGQARP